MYWRTMYWRIRPGDIVNRHVSWFVVLYPHADVTDPISLMHGIQSVRRHILTQLVFGCCSKRLQSSGAARTHFSSTWKTDLRPSLPRQIRKKGKTRNDGKLPEQVLFDAGVFRHHNSAAGESTKMLSNMGLYYPSRNNNLKWEKRGFGGDINGTEAQPWASAASSTVVATGSNVTIREWRYKKARLSPDLSRRSATKSIRKKFTRFGGELLDG